MAIPENTMSRTLPTALALILSAGLAHAGVENAGTTAGNFLSVGTGAGILSMGGATLGAGGDLNAAAWNPAVLGRLASSQYALSHASLALDVSQDWIAASGRVGRSETRWAASALYQNDGSFDGRDSFGAPTGSFDVSNLALGLALARPFSPDVTAGARLNVVRESLGPASGSGIGFDLGVQARRGAFGFGAAARNLGGKMKYDSGSYDLPGVFGLGASWSDAAKGLRFALDANFPRAYYNDVRLGGEWTWQQRVALRAGYRLELGAEQGEPLGGPSFGLGTGVNGLWFDYAFLAGDGQAQGAHRFGLTFHPSFFQQRGAMPRAASGTGAESAPLAAATPESAAPAKAAMPPPAAPAKADEPKREEPAVARPALALPANASASEASARTAAPAAAELAPSGRVKVTPMAKPVAPAPEPVAPAPKAAAPARVGAPVALAVSEATAAAPGPAKAVTAPAKPAVAPAKAAPAAAKLPAADAPAADSPAAPPVAKVAATPAPVVVVVRPNPAPAPKPETAPAQRPPHVLVQKGETLADIARRWGTSVPAIMMENNLVTSQVKPGQKLLLPKR